MRIDDGTLRKRMNLAAIVLTSLNKMAQEIVLNLLGVMADPVMLFELYPLHARDTMNYCWNRLVRRHFPTWYKQR